MFSILPGSSVEDRLRKASASGKETSGDPEGTNGGMRGGAADNGDKQETVNDLFNQAKQVVNNDNKDDSGSSVEIDLPKSTRRVHTVMQGETLSHISEEYYGTSRQWQKILDANKDVLSSPEKLRPGMKLVIPE